MINLYSHECQMHDRAAEIVRRAELARRTQEAEGGGILGLATALRTDLADLLRRAADRVDSRSAQALLNP